MAGEKVASILRSRSNFSEEQIAATSDREGWSWIYAHDKAEAETRAATIEICFTGFQDSDKLTLEAQAAAAGIKVRTKVTQNLGYLCVGPNPGPSKISQARQLGVALITPGAVP